MKATLIFVILLLSPPLATVQRARAETFAFDARGGGHTAKVVFTVRPFDASKHRVGLDRARQLYTIDGRVALGTDDGKPNSEFASLKFYFDGAEVPVPRRLYADCYNPPSLDRTGIESRLAVRFGDDGRSVFVFMCGGDAAGHYDVVWVLRADGRHSRFAGGCGDCGFIDFHTGFFTLP